MTCCVVTPVRTRFSMERIVAWFPNARPREREEAADALRHIRNEAAMAPHNQLGSAVASVFVRKVQGPLQDLVGAVVKLSSPPQGDEPSESGAGGHGGWAASVVSQLKAITLDTLRLYHGAAVDARIANEAARAAESKAAAQASQLETRTAEWQVAEVARQRLERLVARKAAQASAHASDLIAELQRRVATLTQQLDASTAQAVRATAEAAASTAQVSAERSKCDAVTRQLELCMAEGRELSARLAAAQMEAWAGAPPSPGPGGGSGGGGVGGADAGPGPCSQLPPGVVKQLDEQVARLALVPQAHDKVMALVREVSRQQLVSQCRVRVCVNCVVVCLNACWMSCVLPQSERWLTCCPLFSQLAGAKACEASLQAALAAAQSRADAATLNASNLRETARKAEARLEALQLATTSAPAASTAPPQQSAQQQALRREFSQGFGVPGAWSVQHVTAHDVARLRAQVAAGMKEVAALRDQLLQAQQVIVDGMRQGHNTLGMAEFYPCV